MTPPSARAFQPRVEPVIEVVPARFRLDQDDAARVWARLVAVEGQPVRPEYIVEPAQAFGADLTGDLATEDRLIESAISHRLGIEAAEAFERRPGLPAGGPSQVGGEARQALELVKECGAFRGTGTEQSIRKTSGTSCPAAASCMAISNATMPPIDHPPRMYGPPRTLARSASTYRDAMRTRSVSGSASPSKPAAWRPRTARVPSKQRARAL